MNLTSDISGVSKPVEKSGRLLSIDALRGFDMFWIIGGEEFIKTLVHSPKISELLKHWTAWPVEQTVDEQLEHVAWQGFHFYDLIFPLFLFLVGVVLPFSLGALRERGASQGELYRRILRRTVFLFFLGLVYNSFLQFDFADLRTVGVLQRIAICYGIAGVLMMVLSLRMQVLVTIAILLGYWAILAFVPPPGGTAGDYSKEGNLAGYLDRAYLPSKIKEAYYGYGDNEGFLSTIPAVATAMLGVFAGTWLRSSKGWAVKSLGLALAGGACLGLGVYWSSYFPVIKILWTSSYVLVAGGWSLLLLALFYFVIDGIGLRRWAFFFVVIGVNAITIYMAHRILGFEHLAQFFFGGLARLWAPYQSLLLQGGALTLEWLFLYFLYRHKVYLRV